MFKRNNDFKLLFIALSLFSFIFLLSYVAQKPGLFLVIKTENIKLNPINNLNQLNNRNEFGALLEKYQFKTVIEIGVQSGLFADELLSNWPSFEQYFGVDPWIQQKNYVDWANVDNNEQEKKYQETRNRLNKYGNKIQLIREFSTDASAKFKNNSIDFIYIDARHDYCGVYEDLTSYYSKLKCNGMFAGHDYYPVGDTSDQDWSLCSNGVKNFKNGGAVKGFIIF
jgi:hypothetical protein